MKELMIVKWDATIGPTLIIQYPPAQPFDKDFFLKIWANHELNPNSKVINMQTSDSNFISIIEYKNKEIYFIVLKIGKKEDVNKYQNILLSLSNSIINGLNSKNLPRIISGVYQTLKEYSSLNEEQLFFNLLADKDRIYILKILEKGIILKSELAQILTDNYGFSEQNLDMLLNPFIHLGLIEEKELFGGLKNIIPIKDIFFYRTPAKKVLDKIYSKSEPERTSAEVMYISEVMNFFKEYKFEEIDTINQIARLLSKKEVYNAMGKLQNNPIPRSDFIDLISQNLNMFQDLLLNQLIIEIEDLIFPLTLIKIKKFKPIYLIKIVKERYLAKKINTEQLLAQLKYLS